MKFIHVLSWVLLPVAVQSAPGQQHLSGNCGCRGQLVEKYLGFEVDANGQPFETGDTPYELPYGIKVTGQRHQKGNVLAPTENDLVIFNADGDDDLGVPGEKKVLILNEDNDKSDPDDARFGGVIRFKFDDPVCLIKSVRFLDIEEAEKTFIVATDSSKTKTEKVYVSASGDSRATTVKPPNFFNITSLKVQLGNGKKTASGAIASISIKLCVLDPPRCPNGSESKDGECFLCEPGYYSKKGEPCRQCPPGFFTDRVGSKKCWRCKKNSVSRPGAIKCTRCQSNTVPDRLRIECLPCKPGFQAKMNRKCVKCKKGTYSSGRKCKRCKGNTVSKSKATECTPCGDGEKANKEKSKCVPIPTGVPTESPIGPTIPGGGPSSPQPTTATTPSPTGDRSRTDFPTYSPTTASPTTASPTTASPTFPTRMGGEITDPPSPIPTTSAPVSSPRDSPTCPPFDDRSSGPGPSPGSSPSPRSSKSGKRGEDRDRSSGGKSGKGGKRNRLLSSYSGDRSDAGDECSEPRSDSSAPSPAPSPARERNSGPSPSPAPGRSSGPSPSPAPGRSSGPSPSPAPGRSSGPSPSPAPGRSSGPSPSPAPGRSSSPGKSGKSGKRGKR